MTEPRAQRTLVKSPPELWAEVSDPAALTRLIGDGEISITRLDPETTVAWEGDRVRGTVELEASGWGTRVTLTAELAGLDGAGEEAAAPVAAPARDAAPLPAAERRSGLLERFRRRASTGSASPSSDAHAPDVSVAQVAASRALAPAPPPATDAGALEAVLAGVLDELGSAQKRPYRR